MEGLAMIGGPTGNARLGVVRCCPDVRVEEDAMQLTSESAGPVAIYQMG